MLCCFLRVVPLNRQQLQVIPLSQVNGLSTVLINFTHLVVVPLGFQPANTPLSPAQPTRSMGPNQPFGISFMGTAFSEFKLIGYAFAYEQATHNRLKQLAFPDAIPKTQLADVVEK